MGFVLLFIPMAILFRVIAHFMDKERIREQLMYKGYNLVDIRWTPFGPGWFGEKNARIYEVTFTDKNGKYHYRSCKTSMFAGVYFSDLD